VQTCALPISDVVADRIPGMLFDFLIRTKEHPYNYDPGSGRDNNSLTLVYPTLVSFDYNSLAPSIDKTSYDLARFIAVELLPRTYARKVNIVAHSLGGIIARNAIASFGVNQLVSKIILVGSPSEGATLAAVSLHH